MYYYKYASSSLTSVTEDCLVTSLVISSVDVSNLDENDIRVIVESNYSGQLEGETNEASDKRLEKIVKTISDAVTSSKKTK